MRTWRQAARIGVVVHGPEVVDSGSALKLIEYLERFGRVRAVLGGTMGRLAVLDAGLKDTISLSNRRRPSGSIRELEASSDVLFLLNMAKSRETGLLFGSMVAAAASPSRPLIQIDCGGGFVAVLSGEAEDLAERVASDLSLELLTPPDLPGPIMEGEEVRRTLRGAVPGEPVSVDGRVIGRAEGSFVEIVARGGRIVEVRGAEPKPHGLERLQGVDLERAILRSGRIRRTTAPPMIQECQGAGAALIDHCAEEAFEAAEGACTVVTVGDDTTEIASEIMSRLGARIIGIVDGDADHLMEVGTAPRGSIIITVMPGTDDLVGARVREEIFQGGGRASISAEELEKRVLEIAGDRVVGVKRL